MDPECHNTLSTVGNFHLEQRLVPSQKTLKRAAVDPKWPKPATTKRQCPQSDSPDSQSEDISDTDDEWPSDYPDSIHSSSRNSSVDVSVNEDTQLFLPTGLDGQQDSSETQRKLFEYLAKGEKNYQLQNDMEFWNKVEDYLEDLASAVGEKESSNQSTDKSVNAGDATKPSKDTGESSSGKKEEGSHTNQC